MKRREFCVRVGGSLLAIPAVLHVASCGGDDDSPDAAGNTSFVGMNDDAAALGHTHTFTVLCSDLGGNGATYMAEGPPHTHTIELTGADMAELAAGNTVMVGSTDGPHPHSWVVSKPANACG